MKKLFQPLVATLISSISINFVCAQNITKQHPYKPTVNQNTQIRIEYGCKRPNWDKNKKTITLPVSNIIGLELNNYKPTDLITIENCLFSTRHLVLFNTSRIDPTIELKMCKSQKQNRICCKVVKGEWNVFNGETYVIEKDVKNLQIDHILPFSYIRLNMKDCALASKYYNYLPNLSTELANTNLQKSNKLCTTKPECIKQREICYKMAREFNDIHLCESLENLLTNKD